MKTLKFSNGVTVDAMEIVSVVSNRQTIQFPAEIDELQHLLDGRPSSLLLILKDGSSIEINASNSRLKIESDHAS
jgi:hypothetical protein